MLYTNSPELGYNEHVMPNVRYIGYPAKNAILPINCTILMAGISFKVYEGSAKLTKVSCSRTDNKICSKLFVRIFFCI